MIGVVSEKATNDERCLVRVHRKNRSRPVVVLMHMGFAQSAFVRWFTYWNKKRGESPYEVNPPFPQSFCDLLHHDAAGVTSSRSDVKGEEIKTW